MLASSPVTTAKAQVAVIEGDGIGIDVTRATFTVVEAARKAVGGFERGLKPISAGAAYYE